MCVVLRSHRSPSERQEGEGLGTGLMLPTVLLMAALQDCHLTYITSLPLSLPPSLSLCVSLSYFLSLSLSVSLSLSLSLILSLSDRKSVV